MVNSYGTLPCPAKPKSLYHTFLITSPNCLIFPAIIHFYSLLTLESPVKYLFIPTSMIYYDHTVVMFTKRYDIPGQNLSEKKWLAPTANQLWFWLARTKIWLAQLFHSIIIIWMIGVPIQKCTHYRYHLCTYVHVYSSVYELTLKLPVSTACIAKPTKIIVLHGLQTGISKFCDGMRSQLLLRKVCDAISATIRKRSILARKLRCEPG